MYVELCNLSINLKDFPETKNMGGSRREEKGREEKRFGKHRRKEERRKRSRSIGKNDMIG